MLNNSVYLLGFYRYVAEPCVDSYNILGHFLKINIGVGSDEEKLVNTNSGEIG